MITARKLGKSFGEKRVLRGVDLELALREALGLGHNYIGTEHILLGLARENEGVAARILLDFDVGADKVRDEVIRMLGPGRFGRSRIGPPMPFAGGRRPPQWEYRIEHWPSDKVLAQRLNKLGAERWQLAAVLPDGDHVHVRVIFQRIAGPKPPDERPPDEPEV